MKSITVCDQPQEVRNIQIVADGQIMGMLQTREPIVMSHELVLNALLLINSKIMNLNDQAINIDDGEGA